MSLNDLQKQGLIKPFKVSPAQIRDRLQLAKRDISTAKKLLGSDSDWAFSIAYTNEATAAFEFAVTFVEKVEQYLANLKVHFE